jgi:HopA1 effector protein family
MKTIRSIQKILSEFTISDRGVAHKQQGIEFKNSEQLQQFLYSYYCKMPLNRKKFFNYYQEEKISKPFLRELRKANESSGYYIPGWQILSKLDDGYIVSKSGIKLFVNPLKHFKVSDLPIKTGSTVSIKFPNEKLFSSRGYYIAIGNEGLPASNQQMVRMYFHVKACYAAILLKMITRQFSYIQPIPFVYKTLLDAEDYIRRDSAVMYFNKTDYFSVISFIEKLSRIKPCFFSRGNPLFTKKLFTGISIAEEPLKTKGKESFGQHRCRLISEGIFKAYRKNIFDEIDILGLIMNNFLKWKVNLKYPFLNGNSTNMYKS